MTHRKTIHPALTAIAAVIALSSASAFAQSTDVPADPTATPVVDPAPTVAADPLAPAETTTKPVIKSTSTTAHKATATKTSARARPTPPRTTVTARAAAPAAAITAPVAEAPAVQPTPVEPVALAPVAAAPVAEAPVATKATTIDLLPTAALGGLGLLVLGGGAVALRSRRRRRVEEAEDAEWQQQQAEAEPEAVAEPAMIEPQPEPATVAEPELVLSEPTFAEVAAPEPRSASGAKFIGPVADLPEGFDLSRFGPNVQDAYRGPTEDNPSASLRHRLSRASGMDQQERKLAAEVEAVTGEPILAESDAPAVAPAARVDHVSGDFIFARGNKKPIKRPAYNQ